MGVRRIRPRGETLVKAELFGGDRESIESGVDHPLISKASSQDFGEMLLEQSEAMDAIGSKIIPPPINPDVFAASFNISTRLARSITTMARNLVGLGSRVQPAEGLNLETVKKAIRAKYDEQAQKIRRFILRPDVRMQSFTERMYRVVVDRESIGMGYAEVVRSLEGVPLTMNHVRGVTVRVLKNETGFVQIGVNGKKRYFKPYRELRVMDSRTGEYKATPLSFRATELIPFDIYNPTSPVYGMPRYMASSPAIAGNRLAAIRNVVFFENDACPRMAITVSGGKLAKDSFAMIQQFLSLKGKGAEQAHRVMLLQTDDQNMGMPGGKQVSINIVPLTVGVQDDGSFLKYQAANAEEIREAFGITEAFFRTMDVNRAAGIIGRKITQEQVFGPEKKAIAYRINETVLQDVLGLGEDEEPLAVIVFDDPEPMDMLETAQIQAVKSEIMAATINETRRAMGMQPLPDDLVIGDLPAGLLRVLIGAQMIGNPARDKFEELGIESVSGIRDPEGAVDAPEEEPDTEERVRDTEEKARQFSRDLGQFLKSRGIDAFVSVGKRQQPFSVGDK